MSEPTTRDHDLEEHVDELRKLDRVRKHSAELRDQGFKALRQRQLDLYRTDNWWFDVALAVRALAKRQDQPFKGDEEKKHNELIAKLCGKLTELRLSHIVQSDLSVLAAARILRALTCSPGFAFSQTALVCHYWIIRELYTADQGDWSTGGVRANPEGQVSAYVTGECVHALLSFAEGFSKTADFLRELARHIERRQELNKIDAILTADNAWTPTARKLSGTASLISMRHLASSCCIPCEKPMDAVTMDNINAYSDEFIGELKNVGMGVIAENYGKALEEIMEYRGIYGEDGGQQVPESENYDLAVMKFGERYQALRQRLHGNADGTPLTNTSADDKRAFRSQSAHMIAVAAIMKGAELCLDTQTILASRDYDDPDQKLKKIASLLDKGASDVKKLLHPARNFLSAILDRELALATTEQNLDWQPAELACAAAAYGRLEKVWESDPRLLRAAQFIEGAISHHGLIPSLKIYHYAHDTGIMQKVMNSMTIIAFSQLLRSAKGYQPNPELMSKIIRFFDDHLAGKWTKDSLLRAQDIDDIPIFLATLNGLGQAFIDSLSKTSQAFLSCLSCKSPMENINTSGKANKSPIIACLVADINKIIQHRHLADDYPYIQATLDKKACKIIDKLAKSGRQAEANRLIIEQLFPETCVKRSSLSTLLPIDDDDSRGEEKIEQFFKQQGWAFEYSPQPLKAELVATNFAVFALAEFSGMLDFRINKMIFDHFTVRHPEDLGRSKTLADLFYPDFGLGCGHIKSIRVDNNRKPECAADVQWPVEGEIELRRESVAMTMQRMRSHVSRIAVRNLEPLCSLVLHGPPGTGKTFLVESLALTCGVPLIEVTPSDLVKHGEENVERRARTVFEALSLLTRVVILFDEFDPVLKRRDIDNKNPSIFSFLTPGMLPKLKHLHDRAENRAVAYVLITNLIGDLDEAAVRHGRFDEQVGLFPPDVLSRVGRIIEQAQKHSEIEKFRGASPEEFWRRIHEIVFHTAGKGMTTLGKPGWFTYSGNLKPKTPLSYLQGGDKEKPTHWTEAEAIEQGIVGKGRSAVLECLQWAWVNAWEEKLNGPGEKDTKNAIIQVIRQRPERLKINNKRNKDGNNATNEQPSELEFDVTHDSEV